jgi:hypothetical protein
MVVLSIGMPTEYSGLKKCSQWIFDTVKFWTRPVGDAVAFPKSYGILERPAHQAGRALFTTLGPT